jgi:leader peptidase (prepilin peptidase)/N-methyltransferase
VFVALFLLYFVFDVRHFEIGGKTGIEAFFKGGWMVYLMHIILLSSLIAASAIDLELWVIPVVICWFATVIGLVGSIVSPFIIPAKTVTTFYPFPMASTNTAAIAGGALAGLVISVLLLITGVFKRSYENQDDYETTNAKKADEQVQSEAQELRANHRREILKEVVFVLPVIVCSVISYVILSKSNPTWWQRFCQYPAVATLFGSLCGYFLGGAIVWATRILGTLAFGKEAMGLGDVHLMAAAGVVVGPLPVVVAFFIAPFFGLSWACGQMFFKKIRQIPYGPFLSIGILSVMILHDRIIGYWDFFTFK